MSLKKYQHKKHRNFGIPFPICGVCGEKFNTYKDLAIHKGVYHAY